MGGEVYDIDLHYRTGDEVFDIDIHFRNLYGGRSKDWRVF